MEGVAFGLRRRRGPVHTNNQHDGTAFVPLLRACAKNKDLCRGSQAHDDISRLGLLGKCTDALVTMYAKCGELSKAKDLLHMHKTRDVFTWTALIAGYAQKGQGHNALDSFEQMRQEGLAPDAVTYSSALKACGSIRALDKGREIHDEIAKLGLLRNDVILGTALVDMYAKCGALKKAWRVLEELRIRNVISWNALIAGCAEHGEGQEALDCFELMQGEGLCPDAVTYTCILKACGIVRASKLGQKIHDKISKTGLLKNNHVLGTALVDMYAKFGAFMKARKVLEELSIGNVVSWNALIAGYVEQGKADEALNAFEEMQHDGLSPDGATYVCILKACGSLRAVRKGEEIHDAIDQKELLESNVVLGTALVDMYAKCGALEKAEQVLEDLSSWDVIAWNALIAGYVEHSEPEKALYCFKRMQREGLFPTTLTFACILKACGIIQAEDKGKEIHIEIATKGLLRNNSSLGNALLDMYVKCGAAAHARQVLDELPVRDDISWTVVIGGYVEGGEHDEQVLNCLDEMEIEGLSPDAVTYACILKACGSLRAADKGAQIHDKIAKQGLLRDMHVLLGTALVDMYAKCGEFAKAQQVLEDFVACDVLSWNALIGGCIEHDACEQALRYLGQMQHEGHSPDIVTYTYILKACGLLGAVDRGKRVHGNVVQQGLLEKHSVLGNALVDMYAKCAAIGRARLVLEEILARDVVSWNALIAGCAEHEESELALNCFELMQQEDIFPNTVTYTCVLKACGNINALERGERIDDEIAKQGLLVDDVVLGTALIDFYAKCGAIMKAEQVLEQLPRRDVVAWNALITGCAEHGEGELVLDCFERMQRQGVFPDTTTFIGVLKACGSIGAVDQGERIHDEVAKQGLLTNEIVIGNALLDMYIKCGALTKAQHVLDELPVRNVISWTTLITGYADHGEANQALICFEKMQEDGLPPNATTFLCVLNVCSRLGRLEDAHMYFGDLSTKYGLYPSLEHYTCMVDLFGRAGHLDKAVGVIERMPSFDSAIWLALLGACEKWEDVDVGRWAFDCAVQGDKTEVGAYEHMANIYAAAGLGTDAKNIEVMRRVNKAWRMPTSSKINRTIHSFVPSLNGLATRMLQGHFLSLD